MSAACGPRPRRTAAAATVTMCIDLLALDDFAITPITSSERNHLLELLDDRVAPAPR